MIDRGRSGKSPRLRRSAALAAALLSSTAYAQAQPHGETTGPDDLVVNGHRGSAITDLLPLARFDGSAIASMGATSMAELLKAIAPLTRSANGGDPVYLLNGQRTAGDQEIGTLPPEAIVNVEVLPEQAALKFGYPATRRVVNFITKPRFAAVEVRGDAGVTTEGRAATEDAFSGLTRIANGRRLSLTGEYQHTGALLQSRRHILPDPTNVFDATGNVTSPGGGEIDPLLSVAAGHPVVIAAVPADPGQRGQIAAYAAGADRPRLFDIGPYRTLTGQNDKLKLEGVIAAPISKTISGTFSFSAERSSDRSLQGLPLASILVPSGNPASPFGSDILVNRYLTESAPLRLRTTTTKLNLSGVLRGAIGGWSWDVTGSFDATDVSNHGPSYVDAGAIDRAVAGGADPFLPLDAGLLANRLTEQSRSRDRKGLLKAVANGVALQIPAGGVTVTASAEAERATTHSIARGIDPADITIASTRFEAGLALDVPIAARDMNVLPFLGQLSLNLSGNVRDVQGFGTLSDSSYGLTWTPIGSVQFIGVVKQSGTAPNMTLRAAPTVQTANVPFFDARIGQSVFVTTIGGGNPALAAEQRTERRLTLNLQPFAKRNLTFGVNYANTIIHDQATQVTALTPATEAAFPDQFVRDAAGRLTTVSFRPVNLYRERQQMLVLQANFQGQIGKPPPKSADAKAPPPARPSVYVGVAVTPIIEDHLQLRPGSAILNLAEGDTYDASATRRRIGLYSWSGIGFKSFGLNLKEDWISGIHIRGATPQADLYFAPLLKFDFTAYARPGNWFPHAGWAQKTMIWMAIENPFNQRQRVRDATGATPNRYQPDYIDPLGRTVKLMLRKLF